MSVLEILDILVCRDHLFSFLRVNDLLRLRMVSKTFKDEAEDFIRIKKVETKERLIFDLCEDDPFREFNQNLGNSLTYLPLRTRADVTFPMGKVIMLDNLRQDFINMYASSITHLWTQQLTLPLYSPESKFQLLDSFPNVTHLETETVYLPPQNEIPLPLSQASSTDQENKLPVSLKSLKSLFIWEAPTSASLVGKQREFEFITQLVETCLPTLEELELPFHQLTYEGVDMKQVMRLFCKCVFNSSKLKLRYVAGSWVEDLLEPSHRTPEMRTVGAMIDSINEKIISINNPQTETFRLELPNLERIAFHEMDECSMPGTDDDFVRRDWPKLKEIVVNLEDYLEPPGNLPSMLEESYPPKLLDVWDFLFGNGIQRENMVSLEVYFDGFQEENIAPEAIKETLQRTMDLMTSCPNLKILHIRTEIKQLVNLQQLWMGLPLLEDVSFDNCKDLADSDFIGSDSQNPVFRNLKKLKKFALWGISCVGLTNALLSKVLCHMPIQKLTLAGQHSINLEGLQSLLTGRVASRIESLDVMDLHLSDVSNEEKSNLVRLF